MKRLILVSIAVLSLGLAGCDKKEALGANGQPICVNTAIPFEFPMESFVVSENLEQTGSWDYLNAIEPADLSSLTTDQKSAFEYIKDKTNTQFAAASDPLSPENGITSFNNSLDTMESVIANESVGNLNSARAQMLQAMELNVTCSYYNTAAYLSDKADNKKYYIVRYNHITESTQGTGDDAITTPQKVDKILIEYEKIDDIDDEGNPIVKGNVTSTLISSISPTTFSATGYNLPLSTVIQFIESNETLNHIKNYQKQVDTVEVIASDAFTLENLVDIKRIKLTIDYQSLNASIFHSKFINAYECENGDIIYDPTISTPDETISEDDLELTIPTTKTTGGTITEACKNPIKYYDPNYDYNPKTDKQPETILPPYIGSSVSSRQ